MVNPTVAFEAHDRELEKGTKTSPALGLQNTALGGQSETKKTNKHPQIINTWTMPSRVKVPRFDISTTARLHRIY
jgi:hypothetical protein